MAPLVGLFSELFLSHKETGAKLPKYDACLSSYISACQEDSEVKSFDSLLHQRTIKLMGSVYGGEGKTRNLPIDSLVEICGFLVEVSKHVVNTIIDNKNDLSKNKELKSLVDLYFESTTKTLNLFNTVEKGVEKANMIQLLIRVAIKQFETESLDTEFEGNKNKYVETLEKLNKVKAMEDPFGEEFATQYDSVYVEQVMLLDKIREVKVRFEKKHKNVKIWRILGNIVFVASLISVIALSIYFAVITIPVGAVIAIGLATAPVAAAGKWVNAMLKGYEKAFKRQKDLWRLTEKSTKVNIEAMETIKNLVETLIIKISSILKTMEVASEKREEEAVKLVMQEMIEKVEGFAKQIKQVGAHVAECSESVVSGRVVVLKHMTNSDSSKGKW